jgi:hypothetical protein
MENDVSTTTKKRLGIDLRVEAGWAGSNVALIQLDKANKNKMMIRFISGARG